MGSDIQDRMNPAHRKAETIPDWIRGHPGAITVCDRDLRVVYINAAASRTWAERGGASLVGTDLPACHSPGSRDIILRLLAEGGSNVYTVEKAGVRKLVHQCAWRDLSGEVAGLVEVSLVLPDDLPHRVRG